MPFEVYFSVTEVATRLGKSSKTVKRWCEAGELGTVYRLAGELTVAESAVMAFLGRHVEDFSPAARMERRVLVERMRPQDRTPGPGISARCEGELRRKVSRCLDSEEATHHG